MSSVLIVDDEPRIREFLARWLTPAGYDVSEAPDADAALAAAGATPPDVVLCDVQMPGHDGLWLVDELRRRFPAIAIVLATASVSVPPAVSLQGGVVEYLVKPFERERVLAAVSRAVAWHEAAAARQSRRTTADPVGQWLKGRPR